MKLEDLRKKIESIDRKLIYLLNQRMKITEQIGREKYRLGLPVKDQNREKFILSRLKNHSFEKIDSNFLTDIFQIILKKSREIQQNNFRGNP